MKFYADLHIHSHYSRATSKDLDLEHLWMWAQIKGIQLVGTGDFVHPKWLKEIKEKVEPAEEGFFKLKPEYAKKVEKEVPISCRAEMRFMLSVEISNIYKRHDKVRKVHNLIYVPDFKAADQLQARLEQIGNIRSDGRPILGLDSHDLLEITLETDPKSYLIPAHIWTPWFSALGSKGGFDTMEDCFGELTKHIFAVETGLSSDPVMNWRLKQLDPFILVSNSDAHSPGKLAREATVYDTEFSYSGIYRALSDPKDKGLAGTIEFFPEEGKYHYDGHRMCKTRMHPKETIANQGLCPVCKKGVTVGVMARVEELADRPEGEKSPRARSYYNLISLAEIIGQAKGNAAGSKGVQQIYWQLISKLGNELFILQQASVGEIARYSSNLVAEGVRRMREGKVDIAAGYDGDFGKIHLFSDQEREAKENQFVLFNS
jgi:DNA helicase-2/ATP-dependent DNA helicase PcrA